MGPNCRRLLTRVLGSMPAHIAAKFGGDAETASVVNGKRSSAFHCATRQGNPAIVKALYGALRGLFSKEVQSRTDEQLAKDIAGGTAQKKAIKPLQEYQMKDVIAFALTMAKKWSRARRWTG